MNGRSSATGAGGSSRPWNFARRVFPGLGRSRGRSASRSEGGSALIVALWVILILSLLIGSFAFDMRVEAAITSHYRKRVKADYLARAGVEWAKLLFDRRQDADPSLPDDQVDDVMLNAEHLSRGMGITGFRQELGDGTFTVDILPEEGRRNVNKLTREEWEEILDEGGVPVERWDELIDCFTDWTDANDEHEVNGAEADDAFYVQRGYAPKNGPVDSIDEMLLIKGFDEKILYGGMPDTKERDAQPMLGIAKWLTTWGNGKVNANTASREVLMSIPGITDDEVDSIIDGRVGDDGTLGTRDDGYATLDELFSVVALPADLRKSLSVKDLTYVRVVSVGEVHGVRSGVWAVFQVSQNKVIPVFWREEAMP